MRLQERFYLAAVVGSVPWAFAYMYPTPHGCLPAMLVVATVILGVIFRIAVPEDRYPTIETVLVCAPGWFGVVMGLFLGMLAFFATS